MSTRDYNKHHAQLQGLIGRKCFLTLATNSIKFHIDEDKRGGTYLWIDPPWQFEKGEELIESSKGCPHHKEESYKEKITEWAEPFKPVFKSEITRIEADREGSLRIELLDGFSFFVPETFIPEDEPSWYDHWYLNENKSEPDGTGQPM